MEVFSLNEVKKNHPVSCEVCSQEEKIPPSNLKDFLTNVFIILLRAPFYIFFLQNIVAHITSFSLIPSGASLMRIDVYSFFLKQF